MAWPFVSVDSPLIPSFWPDYPADEDALQAVLEAAYGQCEAFAPVAEDGYSVPGSTDAARFMQAQIMQARALYRSATSGGGDQVGAEGFTVTVFPMDWTVKALLRPARRPVVG